MSLSQALDRVRDRIVAAGGDIERVRVVAVTKGHPAAAVEEALAAGLTDIGESFAQEMAPKVLDVADERARWHFIGQLQRNKVRRIAPTVALWQSIDRLPLAAEVAKRAPGSEVLVQVNLTGDPRRGGAHVEVVPALVGAVRDLGLRVTGLMAVGPEGPPEGAAVGFAEVVALADRLELPERSIGMSDDLEVAVAAGSTMVRIGTALFGPRSEHPFGPIDVED